MHRRQGPAGFSGRVWTSLSFEAAVLNANEDATSESAESQEGSHNSRTFEIGITLENLGHAPLLIDDLSIAQQLDETLTSNRLGADELQQCLQPIGRLVALPGEITVISSLRLQPEFRGRLSELLEFKMNSNADLDCIVRYAIDTDDICTKTSRHPWTVFSHCLGPRR